MGTFGKLNSSQMRERKVVEVNDGPMVYGARKCCCEWVNKPVDVLCASDWNV